jgi:prepilin-type N-terminal cleavage/methylation domain-containing protein
VYARSVQRNIHGVTLIELVTVIALLGLMTGAALPRLMDLDAVRCIHAAQSVTSHLRYGQIQAMQSGIPVSAGFSGKQLKTFFLRDADGKPVTEGLHGVAEGGPSGPGHLPWDLSSDVDAVTTDLEDEILWFQPDLGEPEEGAGAPSPLGQARTITLYKGDHQATIFIYPDTGFVRLEK